MTRIANIFTTEIEKTQRFYIRVIREICVQK